MKITRRQLAAVAAGSAAVSFTAITAQTPESDWDKAARESHRENSDVLRKFEIPMATEPAFHFKA
ncbi:MAG TPA: hypothetical protein VHZ74_24830 [Bryobacteraceae bacterium]|jgi:predicted aconitase|nr:hypothetical protein [Bryobacteraceae bacterium]